MREKRRRAKTLRTIMGIALAMAAAAVPSRGAQVSVVDDAGKPVAEVMVACVKGSTEAALSGPDGRATLPGDCREVYCDRGDRMNDQVKITGGNATCHSGTGVVLTVVARPGLCLEGCYVHLESSAPGRVHHTVEGGVPRRYVGGEIRWDKPLLNHGREERERIPGRWKSRPLQPGRMRLFVTEDNPYRAVTLRPSKTIPHADPEPSPWYCETELGILAAGVYEEMAAWRPPAEVRGRVLGRDGAPVSDVPLFVRPQTPEAKAGERAWTCAAGDANVEPVSGPDGSFRLRIDPLVSVTIEAGWKNYPIGTASVTLHGKPDDELVLRLK